MTKSNHYSIGLLALIAVVGCKPTAETAPPAPAKPQPSLFGKCIGSSQADANFCVVSIVDLLANSASYDGKRVQVGGYVHLGFEDNGIYLHREDLIHNLFENGLWVEPADGVDLMKCQDVYARLEGIFKSGLGGHLGLWGGTLEKVTKCAPKQTRPE